MKIKPEHLAHLKAKVDEHLARYPELINTYESGQFPWSDSTVDLQRRFCFDVLYGSLLGAWMADELYPYMNDDTIYTALKTVCPVLTRRYMSIKG